MSGMKAVMTTVMTTMRVLKRGYCLLALLLMGSVVHADPASQLQRSLNTIRSMQAQFIQRVQRHGQVVQTIRGKVSVYRPGRFRWDIKVPTPQIIVADGQYLWQYEVKLKQVTVSRLSQLQGSPALFLASSLHGLGRHYDVTRRGDHYWLKSIQGDPHRVEIVFHGQQLLRIRVVDSLGHQSTLSFHASQQNIPLPLTLFQFTPPAGVDVLR
jgi:outer membrane lipoprotein carrier protein